MGKIYQINYQVPFYQSDLRRDMTVPALMSVALQLSGEQSMKLGRSDIWVYEHFHFAWIVTAYEISIQRLPKFMETIKIETEATSYNKFFCYRDFRFSSQADEELLTIHSTWVLMNPDSRKAQRVEDEIVAPYETQKSTQLERGHKFAQFDTAENRPYQVRYSDIDMNQHVNNSKYYDWAIDPLGFDFLAIHRPTHIHIKYNHEIGPRQEIYSYYRLEDLTSYHRINENDAQIEIEWTKRNAT